MTSTMRQRAISVLKSCETLEQHKAAVKYAHMAMAHLKQEIEHGDEYTMSWVSIELSALKHAIVAEEIRWMDGKKTEMLYTS